MSRSWLQVLPFALLVAIGVLGATACGGGTSSPPAGEAVAFDFGAGSLGWTAGFADTLVDQDDANGFVGEVRAVPPPVGGSGHYLGGTNASGTMSVWVAGRLAGLEAGADYGIRFEVEIASDIGFGCDAGIGVNTRVEAGAAPYLPAREAVAGWWRMNVDRPDAAGAGRHALVIGDIRNDLPGCAVVAPPWDTRTLSSGPREIVVRATADGSVWPFVIASATWEVPYRLYVTKVVTFVRRIPAAG